MLKIHLLLLEEITDFVAFITFLTSKSPFFSGVLQGWPEGS